MTSHTSISLIVKSPSFLLVSMFIPLISSGILYPGLFPNDLQLPSPLNGSRLAINSLYLLSLLPRKQGPSTSQHDICLPFLWQGKWRQHDKLNNIASMSQICLLSLDHWAFVKPPMQSPSFILKREIVGPLLSHREWNS